MNKVTLRELDRRKAEGQRFSCLTAYDASFARLVDAAGVDLVLVGDSLGMVLQGHDSTLPVTLEDVAYHTAAVSRGLARSLLMADLPFMSYATRSQALESAAVLMRAGAHLVKLEGGAWLAETVEALTQCSVPVCAHLGLMPQAVNQLGGYRVQGRDAEGDQLLADARALEAAGARLLVLECIPRDLARRVTQSLKIPVIGIGAGPDTDAQVLVLHDMLGITMGRRPRFVRNFMEEAESVSAALEAYVEAVSSGAFPAEAESFA